MPRHTLFASIPLPKPVDIGVHTRSDQPLHSLSGHSTHSAMYMWWIFGSDIFGLKTHRMLLDQSPSFSFLFLPNSFHLLVSPFLSKFPYQISLTFKVGSIFCHSGPERDDRSVGLVHYQLCKHFFFTFLFSANLGVAPPRLDAFH